jgi:hypothetical protein
LYLNDGIRVPLWEIPYCVSDCEAFIADGKHVAITYVSWPESYGHIATFYANGKELESYDSLRLIPLLRLRIYCGYYHPYCTANEFDVKSKTRTVRTNQGDEFVFDATSGKIIRQWSPWPLYVVTAASLMLIALIGFTIARMCGAGPAVYAAGFLWPRDAT